MLPMRRKHEGIRDNHRFPAGPLSFITVNLYSDSPAGQAERGFQGSKGRVTNGPTACGSRLRAFTGGFAGGSGWAESFRLGRTETGFLFPDGAGSVCSSQGRFRPRCCCVQLPLPLVATRRTGCVTERCLRVCHSSRLHTAQVERLAASCLPNRVCPALPGVSPLSRTTPVLPPAVVGR